MSDVSYMAEYVLDAKGKVLGRVASNAAKLLLDGNDVILLNAEKAMISGHRRDIVHKYKRKVELKDKANPEHSPYISRRPDFFVKRVIRGMLPYQRPRGKAAFKHLRVYVGVPEGLKDKKTNDIKIKSSKETFEDSITVGELSEFLGYK